MDPSQPAATDEQVAVPETKRAELFGSNWAKSDDLAVTVVGDSDGLSVMTARASSGYAWSTVAKLAVPGVDTDRWIGNYCVTSDAKRAVVVYGARTMLNREEYMKAAGWAAIVDLSTGSVSDLGRGFTMAYFNPSCGNDNLTSLTAFDQGTTRIGVVDATSSKARNTFALDGQWTSATPLSADAVAVAGGDGVARVDRAGTTSVAKTTGAAFDLTALADGTVGYVVSSDKGSTVSTVVPSAGMTPVTIATGPAREVGLARTASGQPVVLAKTDVTMKSRSTAWVRATADAALSTKGQFAVQDSAAQVPAGGVTDASAPVRIRAVAVAKEKPVEFGFTPDATDVHQVAAPQGRLKSHGQKQMNDSATDPVDSGGFCSIPRNDPNNQVLQPKPRQIEWAVSMAVQGHLTTTSSGNTRNLGVGSSYSPQGMFPPRTLVGGTTIPPQIVLGVIAQESNMWQADRYTFPGGHGNPLIGNFYGTSASSELWEIDFTDADCGYGVGQITDGMRKPGLQRPGTPPALPADQQRAIALDYAANVAKTVQMLGDKWNELAQYQLVLNGGFGGSTALENWFFAVWDYNSGFHPPTGTDSRWGVGWMNNPINTIYKATRKPFLDEAYGGASDAAHPQDWPYPEKVMGFAAWSLQLPENVMPNDAAHPTGYTQTDVAGARPAWWTSDSNRTNVKPPIDQFCNPSFNECNPTAADPCSRQDFECWWHLSTGWQDCELDQCGFGFIRFPYPDYAAPQADGTSLPGVCDLSGLPSGALVVDDIPSSVPVAREGCAQQASHGSFALNFGGHNPDGSYESKIDLHQQGGGFNDHFWWGHAWQSANRRITGTWTLDRSLNQWTRVMVHIPSFAAWDPQALYTVNYGRGSR